jgi:hypothetical protein
VAGDWQEHRRVAGGGGVRDGGLEARACWAPGFLTLSHQLFIVPLMIFKCNFFNI